MGPTRNSEDVFPTFKKFEKRKNSLEILIRKNDLFNTSSRFSQKRQPTINRQRSKSVRYMQRYRRSSRAFNPEKSSFDRLTLETFQQLSMNCYPVSDTSAENGYFFIRQDNEFVLECEEGMIQPLYTSDHWKCGETPLLRSKYHIPTICTERILPSLVSMRQKFYFIDPISTLCNTEEFQKVLGAEWIKYMNKYHYWTFKTEGLEFVFDKFPVSDVCMPDADENGIFLTKLEVTFRVTHTPHNFTISRDAHTSVMRKFARVDRFVRNCITTLSLMRGYERPGEEQHENFFEVDKCDDKGRNVQRDQKKFLLEVPACRFCDRGLYLDKEFDSCLRCPHGWYSTVEQNECFICPTIEKFSVSADSLADCFAVKLCSDCGLDLLGEACAIAITFHLTWIVLQLWNLRINLANFLKSTTFEEDERPSW
ncbi:hypothetical protein ElyMa_003552100 [Elysia marginata]|uniref:Tyrosine-protein kinase ephrin type A/B receptor-like domain-containing protein n=1 Tax=Elysia marginata TaxID=1093978 RepID=A0AAV4ELW9_9GAST|nr:hypothetical protein ElyMa_003552100 [Elysia marginata]